MSPTNFDQDRDEYLRVDFLQRKLFAIQDLSTQKENPETLGEQIYFTNHNASRVQRSIIHSRNGNAIYP